jgi:dimethylhistidine N-methyltransferase
MHQLVEAAASPGKISFLDEVLRGLSLRQKALPSRLFYDERGSELFEQITELPEYYPTRTEIGLLKSLGESLREVIPAGAVVVEFGSGSSRKTELLLENLESPRAYVPIEISASALYPAAARIAGKFPGLEVYPLLRGFHELVGIELPLNNHPRIGFFPGSTIGNLTRGEAISFLRSVRALLGPSALFLAGADLQKSLDILLPAYDDAKGVTAAFNRNILVRINRELRGTFDPNLFDHSALYNEGEHRVEMHLRARRAHLVSVASRLFEFQAGETIHTENSHKYTAHGFQHLSSEGGWTVRRTWIDENRLFSLHLLA